MADIAGWIALAATSIAAIMTASNLGARVTGWGFALFALGAVAWIVASIASHQTQLFYSNLFLGLVDVFGVWRWLGRRARISDTALAEEQRSNDRAGESLFSVAKLDGLPVESRDGDVLATSVDALASCVDGRIDCLIIRAGGIGGVGETLYRMPWSAARVSDGTITTSLDRKALVRLPVAADG